MSIPAQVAAIDAALEIMAGEADKVEALAASIATDAKGTAAAERNARRGKVIAAAGAAVGEARVTVNRARALIAAEF